MLKVEELKNKVAELEKEEKMLWGNLNQIVGQKEAFMAVINNIEREEEHADLSD